MGKGGGVPGLAEGLTCWNPEVSVFNDYRQPSRVLLPPNDSSGPQRGYTFYEVASVNDSGSLSSNTGIDGMRGRVITDTHYHVTGYIEGVLA